YIGLARQQELRITHIIETHTHADHVSGATRLAARTGATVLIHRAAQISYPHQDVEDGEEILVGTVRLVVLHTPGHSLDSISLLVQDMSEATSLPRLLSGDTLFVGEVGRPDLHGTEADELAALLHMSLYERLLHLDDQIEVYPAHLAGSLCGRRIAPAPSTTIGQERATNPMLAFTGREAFVQSVIADLPPRPPNVAQIVHLNRTQAPLIRPKVARSSLEEVVAMLSTHAVTVIDGRDFEIFAQGHIQGAINVPISYGQFGVMVAWLMPPDAPLLLIASDEEDLADAVDSLMVVGMTNPLSALANEPDAWKASGLTMVETPLIQATELASLLEAEVIGTLVDVREIGEMEKGTIEGAVNLSYRTLQESSTLPLLTEPVVVFCNSGNRSGVAASVLERQGISVLNVRGGTTAWSEVGLPLVQPSLVS
ncbi:MAG TPA: MBL fold metallo-hydrolase, partial [Ktedonobacter sp.]|nr:MBL fold metallo-hydrolase [Ktedonobacter sp.]